MLDRGSTTEDEATLKVGVLASALGVDAHEVQRLPNPLDEVVQIEVLRGTDHEGAGQVGQSVHLLNRDLVNLIVALQQTNKTEDL